MNDQIEFLRNLVRGRINEIETFPKNQERSAELFQNWVKELNTAIKILYRVGDHCFAGFPTFGFPAGFFTPSRESINDTGYKALVMYLDTVKSALNTPVYVR